MHPDLGAWLSVSMSIWHRGGVMQNFFRTGDAAGIYLAMSLAELGDAPSSPAVRFNGLFWGWSECSKH